jgi:hypothetical protein
MSLSSTSSVDVVATAALLVRDVDGQYRPARAEEVLLQARRVLSQRVRRGATMSSPQVRISDQRDRPFRHRDRPFRERDRPFR